MFNFRMSLIKLKNYKLVGLFVIMVNILTKSLTHFIRDKIKRKEVRNILLYNKLSAQSEINGKKYKINGKNNKIIIVDNGKERELKTEEIVDGINIEINGNNNILKIQLPIKADNLSIQIGNDIPNDNVYIEIGTFCVFMRLFIRCWWGNGQVCKIGRNTTIWSCDIFLDSFGKCVIGEDCQFSDDIKIWGDDGHSILDANTGEILNEPKGAVTIGNHVWVGEAVRITKNARIHDNSIIGGGAVAYKDYEESNVVIAGNPGKIVRRNITWDRRNTYFLQRERESNF